MSQITLPAHPRTGRGKGPARRLRAAGRFPAIVYGGDREPEPVAIDAHGFERLLHRELTRSSLINLQVEGAPAGAPNLVILRDLQRDPVDRQLRHADFYRVRLDQMVEFEIPVHGTGVSPAIKAGGILEHVARTVRIRCKPLEAPDHLDIALETLDFGHSLHAKDLRLGEGVELLTDPDQVIFSIVVARAVVSEQAAAEGAAEGAAPAEPEVISKGKKEEEKEA